MEYKINMQEFSRFCLIRNAKLYNPENNSVEEIKEGSEGTLDEKTSVINHNGQGGGTKVHYRKRRNPTRASMQERVDGWSL